MKTSKTLILEVIEDVISEEMMNQRPVNLNQVDDYESVLNSLISFPPLDDIKWEYQNSSNRPLNKQYIDDNIKECIKMKYILEHEMISHKTIDFESRFTLEKMIDHTNQIICLLDKCQKCIDGISKTVYVYRELQQRVIDEMESGN